jgi:hypothetical protein
MHWSGAKQVGDSEFQTLAAQIRSQRNKPGPTSSLNSIVPCQSYVSSSLPMRQAQFRTSRQDQRVSSTSDSFDHARAC